MPTVCALLPALALTLAQISPKRSFPHLTSCSKWLVDIGCGFGVATEVLLRERVPAQWTFETASYPKTVAGKVQMKQDYRERFAHIGIGDVSGLCVIGLDGNPWFQERLRQREKELLLRGHPAVFFAPAALTGYNGKATFLIDDANAGVNFWGSSLFSNANTRSGRNVTVPALTLSTLFQEVGIREDSEVILHMNAEGGEFTAIPQAISDGSLCRFVDHLTIDLHYKYFACRPENGIRGRRCDPTKHASAHETFSPAELEQWVQAPGCHVKSLKVWGLEAIATNSKKRTTPAPRTSSWPRYTQSLASFGSRVLQRGSIEASAAGFPWTNGPILCVSSKAPYWPYRGLRSVLGSERLVHRRNCSDLRNLGSGRFRAVWASHVLEVSKTPWRCVKQLHRVLKPNGTVLLEARGLQPRAPKELFRFMPAGLKALADASGFSVTLVDGYGSREVVLQMLRSGEAAVVMEHAKQGSTAHAHQTDSNYYLQSWLIGRKAQPFSTSYIHPVMGQGRRPTCTGCMEYTSPLGPGMLEWKPLNTLRSQRTRQAGLLRWNDSLDATMQGHVLRKKMHQPFLPLRCGPTRERCSKATRIPSDKYIQDRISAEKAGIGRDGQHILMVSPPPGIEPWGANLRQAHYAVTLFENGLEETCELLPFADEQFDQVWSNMVLEHTVEPWSCFQEFRRVLRAGGTLIAVTPAFYPLHTLHYPDTFRFFPEGLRALAEFAGFRSIEAGGFGRKDFLVRFVEQDDRTNKGAKDDARSQSFRELATKSSDNADLWFTSWLFADK
jgi:SAM-dependent methyltransferase